MTLYSWDFLLGLRMEITFGSNATMNVFSSYVLLMVGSDIRQIHVIGLLNKSLQPYKINWSELEKYLVWE